MKNPLSLPSWRLGALAVAFFWPRLASAIFICGFLLLITGCGRGPVVVHLSGTVTYDGKPVPAGEILFDPDVTKKHDGPQGFSRIKNGKYDTRDSNKPITPGPHVVRILGFDGTVIPEAPYGKQLFPAYQAPADVKGPADVKMDFDVKR